MWVAVGNLPFKASQTTDPGKTGSSVHRADFGMKSSRKMNGSGLMWICLGLMLA
jgi:hypothetical protein